MVQTITFGEWLKRRRRVLDLTQQALADRVNCSVETIYKIEGGQRRPSAQIARLLGEELNIPTHELEGFIKFARSDAPTKLHTHHVEIAPWRDAFIPNNNLPLQLTTLIGRERYLEDALRRLRQEDVRLVTIVGPPGIGKTRLAIQLGNDALLDFPDGVYFVELATVIDPQQVVPKIARTLDISLTGRAAPLDNLKNYLYERQLLLILDNFEQILESAPDVYTLLMTCPLVKIVVTSRAPLQVRGERQLPVNPLALPSRINDLDVANLARYSAVRLFLARAAAVQPDFMLTDDNHVVVGAICAQLDGLPLAIEIVAPQVKVLEPAEILKHLSGQRLLQTKSMDDTELRHQTLNRAINWSYQLLNAADQRVFCRMGIFTDGCTLDAAEVVCQPEQDIVYVLTQLVNMNLVKRAPMPDGTSRYLMLETIRQFARHELQTQGEWADVQARHAAYFRDFAVQHEESIRRDGQVVGLEQVERDHSNLLSALDYALATQTWEQGMALAGALIEFWVYHNHILIGLGYIRDLLARTMGRLDLQAQQARLLNGAAMMSYFAGDFPMIARYAEDALKTAEAARIDRDIAWACITLGMNSGGMARFDEANAHFERGLTAARHIDETWCMASALNGFGEVARSQGRYERALEYFEQALRLGKGMGNIWVSAHILDNMGHTAYSQGRFEVARDYIRQSMEASIALGDERGIAMCLEKMGGIALARQQLQLAARLLGAAEALREAKNTPVEGMDAADYQRFVEQLRQQLPAETLEAAWNEGRDLPLAQIIDQTLEQS